RMFGRLQETARRDRHRHIAEHHHRLLALDDGLAFAGKPGKTLAKAELDQPATLALIDLANILGGNIEARPRVGNREAEWLRPACKQRGELSEFRQCGHDLRSSHRTFLYLDDVMGIGCVEAELDSAANTLGAERHPTARGWRR